MVEPEDGVERRLEGAHEATNHPMNRIVRCLDRRAARGLERSTREVEKICRAQHRVAKVWDSRSHKRVVHRSLARDLRKRIQRRRWLNRKEVGLERYKEHLAHDAWDNFAIHFRLHPIPVGKADVAVAAKGQVRTAQSLLELVHVWPMPGCEARAPVRAILRVGALRKWWQPAVDHSKAEPFRRAGAVHVLAQLEAGAREADLFRSRHPT
mmetsp:Transcript_24978/g.68549  ORF Transcript_24978/g.68549 Transcript_24978/m.68549 type:complete len:210 (+) Transcript_24978:2060-2689(+)